MNFDFDENLVPKTASHALTYCMQEDLLYHQTDLPS